MTLLRILGCSRSTECCRITWCKQIWNLPNTRRNSTIFKRTVTALQLPLYFPHVPPPTSLHHIHAGSHAPKSLAHNSCHPIPPLFEVPGCQFPCCSWCIDLLTTAADFLLAERVLLPVLCPANRQRSCLFLPLPCNLSTCALLFPKFPTHKPGCPVLLSLSLRTLWNWSSSLRPPCQKPIVIRHPQREFLNPPVSTLDVPYYHPEDRSPLLCCLASLRIILPCCASLFLCERFPLCCAILPS